MADEIFTPHDFEALDTSDFEPIEEAAAPRAEKSKTVLEALGKKVGSFPQRVMDFASELLPSAETVEDTAAGGVQGATLGFADELEGAARAAGGTLAGPKPLSEFPELYRQYQRASEQGYDAARERSPNAFLAGEVGGGLLTGLATAGSGLAAGAGSVGLREGMKQAGRQAFRQAVGTAGTQGAKAAAGSAARGALVGGLAERAIPGAAVGALTGVGTSKHNIDTPEEREKLGADVVGSSLMGGALSAAVPAVAEGLGAGGKALGEAASDYIQESPFLRQIGKSFQMGRGGQVVSEAETAVNRAAREQSADIAGLTNRMKGAADQLGQDIGRTIDKATSQGVKVPVQSGMATAIQDLSQAMQANKLAFGTKESDQILAQLSKLGAGQLTPTEARTLKGNLFQMMQGIEDPSIRRSVSRFYDSVDQSLVQAVPGLKELNKRYSSFLASGPEVLLARGQPSEIVNKFLSSLTDPQAKVGQAVQEMLSSLSAPGVGKASSRRTYTELVDRLREFEGQNPGLLKKIGIGTPEEFGQEILDKADKFAIQRQALGYEPHGSPISSVERGLFGLANTGRGAAISGANLAGRAAEKLSGSAPARVSRNLYQAADSELAQVADMLEKSGLPGIESLGVSLRKGLQNKNKATKNAALFTILQDPRARLLISPEEVGE